MRLRGLAKEIADAMYWRTGEYPTVIIPSYLDILHSTSSASFRSAPVVKGRLVNVPARNDFFTGREEILSKLHEALRDGERAAVKQAISGLGGIGKTQIAIEYAHRYADAYSHVFWVSAESESALTSGFASLAQELGLPVKQEQSETVAAVKRWMTENSGWLMIFDNADAPEIVTDFIPAPLQGKVLLTSRAQNFDALGVAAPISLDVLSPDEAFRFFLTRTGKESLNEDEARAARELAEEFGWLPLALEQAAAYVSVRKIDFKKYLEMYRARRKDVLSQTNTETVATIWRANFDDVEAESPAAADILRISAFFAPDDIPLELIEKGATEISESVAAAMRTALTVNDVLEPLMRYSLIHLNEANATYGVHRLLQAIMQDAMTEPERRNWAEKAVKAVDGAFPDVSDFYQWGACERFLPHGTHLAGVMDEFGLETAEAATVLNDCGHFLKERARYGAALPLLKRALAIREKALGSEHPDTAGSLNNLAELYSEQGEYGKAEPLYERALAITEKALGVEHPDMAASLNNLAALYYARGEYGKALPLFERALAIWEKALGGEHPLTATSLNNLAELYQAQREYAKALPLYERALAIWEEALGADHPETARALNNLALLYYVQGNYAKPEPLCVRALEIFEKALGPEHPLTKKCAGLLSRIRHGLDAQGVGAHVVEPTT